MVKRLQLFTAPVEMGTTRTQWARPPRNPPPENQSSSAIIPNTTPSSGSTKPSGEEVPILRRSGRERKPTLKLLESFESRGAIIKTTKKSSPKSQSSSAIKPNTTSNNTPTKPGGEEISTPSRGGRNRNGKKDGEGDTKLPMPVFETPKKESSPTGQSSSVVKPKTTSSDIPTKPGDEVASTLRRSARNRNGKRDAEPALNAQLGVSHDNGNTKPLVPMIKTPKKEASSEVMPTPTSKDTPTEPDGEEVPTLRRSSRNRTAENDVESALNNQPRDSDGEGIRKLLFPKSNVSPTSRSSTAVQSKATSNDTPTDPRGSPSAARPKATSKVTPIDPGDAEIPTPRRSLRNRNIKNDAESALNDQRSSSVVKPNNTPNTTPSKPKAEKPQTKVQKPISKADGETMGDAVVMTRPSRSRSLSPRLKARPILK
ncbi:hypothetical protein QBC38DRAFT_452685 [Podospora fimiseda]|uniref:Uncharacterized protein n=1 Tax=Podospora fimiseda TaxID=252190 RepID=A0AAN7BUW6_9PEZI|nr:hypothetical protein QBC38DRAFT_452685 [Podospora fimiseda]